MKLKCLATSTSCQLLINPSACHICLFDGLLHQLNIQTREHRIYVREITQHNTFTDAYLHAELHGPKTRTLFIPY